jgi:hypothetical protein
MRIPVRAAVAAALWQHRCADLQAGVAGGERCSCPHEAVRLPVSAAAVAVQQRSGSTCAELAAVAATCAGVRTRLLAGMCSQCKRTTSSSVNTSQDVKCGTLCRSAGGGLGPWQLVDKALLLQC